MAATKRYRYANYAQMMQTPPERWRLIIAAIVLLHILLICGINVDLRQTRKVPPKTIALILQKAPLLSTVKTPTTPSSTVLPTTVQQEQLATNELKPIPQTTPKPNNKPVNKPINKPLPPAKPVAAKNRYLKPAPVKPATIAKTPPIAKPVAPSTVAMTPPASISNIPDDLSQIQSVGIPVIAASSTQPKPTVLAQAQPSAPSKPSMPVNKPVIHKTPAPVTKPEPQPIKPTETVKHTELAQTERQDINTERLEQASIANQLPDIEPLETVETPEPEPTTLEEVQRTDLQMETVKAQHNEQQSVANHQISKVNTPLIDIQVVSVPVEKVYPSLISQLLDLVQALVPIKEITQIAKPEPSLPATPTQITQTPASPTSNEVAPESNNTSVSEAGTDNGKEEKIPEQYMSSSWQRAAKQTAADNTAKELAQTEQDEKLGKLVFKEHKDYGDIPDVAPDKTKTNDKKKSKGLDLGFNVGDCFVGYKSSGDAMKAAKQQNGTVPINCDF